MNGAYYLARSEDGWGRVVHAEALLGYDRRQPGASRGGPGGDDDGRRRRER
jgi:hypothetical protein